MPFNDTFANDILSWAFGKKSLAARTKVYIGLSSNDPEEDGGIFEELSGGGYSRVLIGQYGETYPDVIAAATGRAITNKKQFNWTKATAKWPDAHGMGLFENESGGIPYYYCKLDEPLETPAGAVALFDPGALEINFPETDVSTAVATASE